MSVCVSVCVSVYFMCVSVGVFVYFVCVSLCACVSVSVVCVWPCTVCTKFRFVHSPSRVIVTPPPHAKKGIWWALAWDLLSLNDKCDNCNSPPQK